jgi:hypothetical protein
MTNPQPRVPRWTVTRSPHASAGTAARAELSRTLLLGPVDPAAPDSPALDSPAPDSPAPDSPALRYAGHYTAGVLDFSVDRLPGPTARDDCQRIGSQLTFTVADLDRVLRHARTGGLIRTVLHTLDGAMFCDFVVPESYLVALATTPGASGAPGRGGGERGDGGPGTRSVALSRLPGIRAADRSTAALVDAMRAQLRLGPQNLGGWLSERPAVTGTPEAAPATPLARPAPGGRGPAVAGTLDLPGDLAAEFQAQTGPDALHYVAYCRAGEPRFALDHFDHPGLRTFFEQSTPDAQRRFYGDFARDLAGRAVQLGKIVRPVLGRRMARMVLDVEQGAIFYYRVGPGEYLVGVTLDQREVATADDRLGRLAVLCQENSGESVG